MLTIVLVGMFSPSRIVASILLCIDATIWVKQACIIFVQLAILRELEEVALKNCFRLRLVDAVVAYSVIGALHWPLGSCTLQTYLLVRDPRFGPAILSVLDSRVRKLKISGRGSSSFTAAPSSARCSDSAAVPAAATAAGGTTSSSGKSLLRTAVGSS